ncbi:MAG: Uma2 family endonuclease [Chloroflexia bacterium]|nr:Uma2 family endonuclease [Chloroflexia bacterium]
MTWRFKERLELIKGKIFKMSPAPAREHQSISSALHGEFRAYLKRKKCKVYHAPFDVRLPNGKNNDTEKIYTVVQPDIAVICDPDKLDSKGCLGAPDLIIEILSPASAAKDTKDKFQLYQESGVKEYWMVYPGEKLIEVFKLNENGKYRIEDKYNRNETIHVNMLGDLKIELVDVFEEEFLD